MWTLKYDTNEPIYKTETDLEGVGEGIDMYTLMCIKLMTNKNLQYKKPNKQNN